MGTRNAALKDWRSRKKVTKDRNAFVLVELLLLCSHVHTEDLLYFGGKRFLHVFLNAPQKERLEDFVETLITVITPFPVYVVKVLPGVKPVVHNKEIRRHSSPGRDSDWRAFPPLLSSAPRETSKAGRTCQAWGSATVTRALWGSSAAGCRLWGACGWTWTPLVFCTAGSRRSSACALHPRPETPSLCSRAPPARQMLSSCKPQWFQSN